MKKLTLRAVVSEGAGMRYNRNEKPREIKAKSGRM